MVETSMSPPLPYLPIDDILNARKTLDLGAKLNIEIRGGRSYNIRKFVEMGEEELEERINKWSRQLR